MTKKRIALTLAGITAVFLLLLSTQRPARGDDTSQTTPQYGDDRFGVILNGDPQQLVTLGTRWFVGGEQPLSVPPGAIWVQSVDLEANVPLEASLATRVAQHPGSYWLMSNEPNVTGSPQQMTGDQYAQALNNAVAVIHQADPTAKIVGPNIINFDFTCVACPGYTSGHDWMNDFLNAYQADFGTLPPIDVWSIHTYPIDFDHVPMLNAGIVEDQLVELRNYLDGIPGLTGAPIWDTELGTHWAYDGLEWKDDGSGNTKAYPTGPYRSDLVEAYMQNVLGWLSTNGPSLNIDRWFFFATFKATAEPWQSVYAGINLVDGPGPDAHLTTFGELYRQLSGLSP